MLFASQPIGYEVTVTVVKDATASYSDEHMHAALDVKHPELRQRRRDHE